MGQRLFLAVAGGLTDLDCERLTDVFVWFRSCYRRKKAPVDDRDSGSRSSTGAFFFLKHERSLSARPELPTVSRTPPPPGKSSPTFPLVHTPPPSHAAVCGLLLRANADPNVSSSYEKRTALHRACFHRSQDVVRLLLMFGANPHARDVDHALPADLGLRSLLEQHCAGEDCLWVVGLSSPSEEEGTRDVATIEPASTEEAQRDDAEGTTPGAVAGEKVGGKTVQERLLPAEDEDSCGERPLPADSSSAAKRKKLADLKESWVACRTAHAEKRKRRRTVEEQVREAKRAQELKEEEEKKAALAEKRARKEQEAAVKRAEDEERRKQLEELALQTYDAQELQTSRQYVGLLV